LLHGDLAAVYQHPGNQAGPFQQLAAAIFRAMVPAGFEVAGLRVAGATALVLGAVVGLSKLRASLGLRPGPLRVLVVSALIAVWEVPGYGLDGHLAELAIPVMWVAAGLAMRKGMPNVGALLVGLSAGWEPWGLLGIPLLLCAPASALRVARLGALAVATTMALYLPFALSGTFAMFDYVWPIGSGSLWHHLMPGRSSFTWWMRAVQGAGSVAVGALVAAGLRSSRHLIWLVPLAVFETRLLLDPIAYDYYYTVPQLLGLIGLCLLEGERRRNMACVAVLAYLQFAIIPASRLSVLAISLVLVLYLAWALRPRATASG
jgi:hypothetical protein